MYKAMFTVVGCVKPSVLTHGYAAVFKEESTAAQAPQGPEPTVKPVVKAAKPAGPVRKKRMGTYMKFHRNP